MVAQDIVLVLVLLLLALNLSPQLLQLELRTDQCLLVKRALFNLLVQLQSQVVGILLSFDESFFEDKDFLSHGLLCRGFLLSKIIWLDQLQKR